MQPSILRVVDGDYCVGCGACAVVAPSIEIVRAPNGATIARIPDLQSAELGTNVCPFADETPNETQLARAKFGESAMAFDERVGFYDVLGAGRLKSTEQLIGSSSGGLTSWVAARLLSSGLVDGVIHVTSESEAALFEFGISRTIEELTRPSRRKSIYYSMSFADLLRQLDGDTGRYAFVGVPCFITAITHLERTGALSFKIPFTLALVCGHLKSAAFAELLAYQVGIEPARLASVDFRKKSPDRAANQYAFQATDSDGHQASATAQDLLGGDWGLGLFQLAACDYCDDVFGELADATFGDAWLPRFEQDWRGTNVIVSRSKVISEMLSKAAAAGEITIEFLGLEDVAATQAGNFRHRWLGLSVRIADDDTLQRWHPRKRVQGGQFEIDERRKAVVRRRRELSAASRVAAASYRPRHEWLDLLVALRRPVRRYRLAYLLSLGPRAMPRHVIRLLRRAVRARAAKLLR